MTKTPSAIPILLLFAVSFAAGAAVVTDDVKIEGQYLNVVIKPSGGGTVAEMGLKGLTGNYAGEGGVAQEGFGVASPYVPNRRLNEKLEVQDNVVDRSIVIYSYDCDGPNIRGLHVTRTMEPIPNEASLRVTWRIENRGKERNWVAPWVRNPLVPGGKFNAETRVDLPTLTGIQHLQTTGYYPASRNWAAVTNPTDGVSVYGVFNADNTHSFLSVWDADRQLCGFQTAFVPKLMNPGDVWETKYRITVARGLKHVDFASDELATQLDYQSGKLVMLMSPSKTMKGMQIHASVVARNGRVWKLPAKAFDFDPNVVIRCTYEWKAPANGAYEFMASVTHGKSEPAKLGQETGSPHGGIDTQFVVGPPEPGTMEAWTDAPYALDRGTRTLKRAMLCGGATRIWIESPLEKIFHKDVPEPSGVDGTIRVALARNEFESFQLVIRPPKDTDLHSVSFKCGPLVNEATGTRLEGGNISAYNVAYCPVRVPSHFEGPTGDWPDALPPFKPFTAKAEQSSPVWFTIYAPPKTPAGKYVGPFEMACEENEPVKAVMEVTVYDFDLPGTPALKTDFGFRSQLAIDGAKRQKCTLEPQAIVDQYARNALDHRVTLREPGQLPAGASSADATAYAAALKTFEPHAKDLFSRGATTFAVPASLLDTPDRLQRADTFVLNNRLQGRAFCPMAEQPPPSQWDALKERMQRWQTNAPDIAMMVTTFGLQPFLPDGPCTWCVHTPILNTVNNAPILDRIKQGKEVWWYVTQNPPRPYANFFVDFSAVENRMLFWQSWALGIRGVYYWCVNYVEKDHDPYQGLADFTPVNGDGFLVYPGEKGPVNSIRWEAIRDGIEDYDYLTLLTERVRALQKSGGNQALVDRATKALDLKALVPDLVSFTRDGDALMAKRDEIARLIVDTGKGR